MNEKIEKWLESVKGKVNDFEFNLLTRAAYTLDANVIYNPEDRPWKPYICVYPSKDYPFYSGIWNWDSAFHAEGLSYWDCELAKQSVYGFFSFQDEKGMLPDVVWNSGEKVDWFTKPPVFAQAVKKVYTKCKDSEFIKEMYPKLCKNAEFWEKYRYYEGLFHYDSFSKGKPKYIEDARNESGWDNSVRWDIPIYDLWAIDLNCFMHDYYCAMSFLANELGLEDEMRTWKSKAEKLAELINAKLWDDENKCYVDVNRFTGEKSTVLTPASFMPLYSKIAPAEYAEHMNLIARDENKFYKGMPTVAYDNPGYEHDGYWRGPTWLNVAYFAAKGLANYGFDTAGEIKDTILGWCDMNKDGIYENYDPISGKGLRNACFSWSCVFIIEFILNF